MISVKRSESGGCSSIELRPNPAMPAFERAVVMGLLAVVMLSMALVYVRLGFWPILPFAAIELGLLYWALSVSARRAKARDVIDCNPVELSVHRHRGSAQETVTMPAPWARLEWQPGLRHWHPSRLFLCSGSTRVQLGGFLLEDERQHLARLIREVLEPVQAY